MVVEMTMESGKGLPKVNTSRSTERVLEILGALARHSRPISAAVISKECAVPKSTTHQVLSTLRRHQYVEYHVAERTWSLGVRLFVLGSTYMRSNPLQRFGRTALVELAAVTGVTAHLAYLQNHEVIYVDMEQHPGASAQVVTEIGANLPAHLTAVGLAILARESDTELMERYADYDFAQRSNRGPQSVADLIALVEPVRTNHFAVESDLTTLGVTSIAAPVINHHGATIAALGITYVSQQRSPQGFKEACVQVTHAARQLSHALGWRSV